MPATYTHYLFAQKCIDRLPKRLKDIVITNKKFYDIGQSGADILFYYKPHKSNDIRKYGSLLHREVAKVQFVRFKEIAANSTCKDMDLAYIIGYFTHFILDSTLHGYIWKNDEQGIAKHFVIEVDYERKLMIANGVNPYSNKFLSYQVNDAEVREIVAKYMNTTPKNIGKILRARKSFIYFIYTQNKFVRGLLNFLLKVSKNDKGFEILMKNDADKNCIEISKNLDILFDKAFDSIDVYGKEFEEFLLDNKPLSERFDVDFE